MSSELSTETWVVTGASRGIGAALARQLRSEGARVVINGRSAESLTELAEAIDAVPIVGDIGIRDTADRLAEAGFALGRPVGVVHNAGVAAPGPRVWELSPEDADAVVGTSLDGAWHLVRAFVPTMLDGGSGTLVFVGSGIADRNFLGLGAYGIAKAGEEYLARQVALEAPELTSFVWRPGVVDTEMQAEARSAPPEVAAIFHGFRDQGQLTTPAEAAADLISRLRGDRAALSGTVVRAGS